MKDVFTARMAEAGGARRTLWWSMRRKSTLISQKPMLTSSFGMNFSSVLLAVCASFKRNSDTKTLPPPDHQAY